MLWQGEEFRDAVGCKEYDAYWEGYLRGLADKSGDGPNMAGLVLIGIALVGFGFMVGLVVPW